jgi:hypothetical protein
VLLVLLPSLLLAAVEFNDEKPEGLSASLSASTAAATILQYAHPVLLLSGEVKW